MAVNKARLFIDKAAEPVEQILQKKTLERKSKNIWIYLQSHPGINVAWLAKQIDWDKSNFNKYRKAKKVLPQHVLLKAEQVLSSYGLNIT